jgi:hypothetical protein
MKDSGNTRGVSAKARLACAAVLGIATVTGCGARAAQSGHPDSLVLGDPAAPPSIRDLSRARIAAHRFAVSFLLVGVTRGRAAVRSAVPSLAHEVNAIAARDPSQLPARGARLEALAAFPQGRGRVEATVAIGNDAGRRYPISFSLKRIGGRWLVVDLPAG